MTGASRVLRPLDEARGAIRLLDEYATPAELGGAVRETWRAVEQSLRLRLRADRESPDELRLAALSPTDLPVSRLLDALRRRDLISMELAGSAHELERAVSRAEQGEVRAADGDLARRVVQLVRSELPASMEEAAGAPVSGGVTVRRTDEEERGLTEGEPAEEVEATPPDRWPGARRLRLLAAAVALLVLVMFIFVLVRSLDDRMEEATAAFAAGRLDEAEQLFEELLVDEPESVVVRLYLGRINRRQEDYEAASEHLRAAAREAPTDPYVRRELGHLFMDLDRPRAAAEQYQRALEVRPDDERAWIGLIVALRAANDSRAEELLRQAPPEVRAVLTRGE